MNIKNLYREVILEHASNPRNKLNTQDVSAYQKKRGYNPSCGDDLVIFLQIDENNIITDIIQHAQGCSISCAASSVVSTILKGLTISQAKNKINNYLKMIKNEAYNECELQNDAKAFIGVKDFPARIKCASLAWVTILEMISEYEEKK